jgi:hypothetical protein
LKTPSRTASKEDQGSITDRTGVESDVAHAPALVTNETIVFRTQRLPLTVESCSWRPTFAERAAALHQALQATFADRIYRGSRGCGWIH